MANLVFWNSEIKSILRPNLHENSIIIFGSEAEGLTKVPYQEA